MIRIRSLREYVDQLKGLGEIVEIDAEIDWNLELGAITRRSYELRRQPHCSTTSRESSAGFRVLVRAGWIERPEGTRAVPCGVVARLSADGFGP